MISKNFGVLSSPWIVGASSVVISGMLSWAALGNGKKSGVDPVTPPAIEFNYDDAVIGGKGCSKEEGASLSQGDGNQVVVSTPQFGVSLNAADPEKTIRAACVVAIPAKLPAGYRVASVSTKGSFVLGKSSGVNLGFSVMAGLSDNLGDPSNYVYENGTQFGPVEKAFQSEHNLTGNLQCGGLVIVRANYAVSAIRNTLHDWVQFQVSQGGVSTLAVELIPCR
jgi:Domain of unknown function (DUF4360)